MSDIKNILSNYKSAINERILEHISEQKKLVGLVGTTSIEALDRLGKFSLGGKGVRGSLSMLSAEMFGFDKKDILLDIAACLEILQASLLIHDDIMDNDLTRRGNPSLFAQYIKNGKEIEANDPLHYGRSMGICIGDIGFFIALTVASNALNSHPQKDKALSLLYKELTIVGLAQMDDITFASSKSFPDTRDILRMYLYKTAHYTFSLPLSLGAVITNQSDKTIEQMEKLGEHIGLLFQLKDDEIGIYSSEEKIGKPIGSDLRENKKTLFRTLLETKLTPQEQNIMNTLSQKEHIEKKDLSVYLSLLEKYNIKQEVEQIGKEHSQNAEYIVNNLEVEKKHKDVITELITFVTNRTS